LKKQVKAIGNSPSRSEVDYYQLEVVKYICTKLNNDSMRTSDSIGGTPTVASF